MSDQEALQDQLLEGVRVAGHALGAAGGDDVALRGLPLHAVASDEAGRIYPLMAQEAQRWTYVLRSRQRWVNDARAREQQQADARATMDRLGLGAEDLRTLAAKSTLVVRVPFQHEAVGWEGRIFPWEYVLAAATREQRLGASGRPSPLTIIRELQVQREEGDRWVPMPRGAVSLPNPLRVMFVNTLPTELREHWCIDEELAQFRRSLPAGLTELRVLDYPSADELTEALRQHRPQLLHFAGMDSHQALRELSTIQGEAAWVEAVQWDAAQGLLRGQGQFQRAAEIIGDTKRMVDGLLLRGSDGLPQLLPAQTLGHLLARAGAPVYLTIFNVWNSSARLAPMLIAEGVTLASIGFQDAFDDSLAEFTLAQLRRWLFDTGFDLPEAFRRSWEEVRSLPESVDATGVTLWVGAPVFVDAATRARHQEAAQRKPGGDAVPSAEVRCEIEPFPELNYAVLHNAQPLFKRFVLACDLPEQAEPLDVDVAVHMGAEVARFQRRVTMRHRRERLTDKIHVPLTAEVARSVHEAINTSLSVRVRQGERVLYHDSHRLRLLPVDQWRDNRRDGRWLPSFVLPRDPAVMRAVAQAQRYNRVLRDDPSAGFEGYQCVPEDCIDEAALRGVDRQVEAIWATLLHDWQLGYINPPPSYSGELDSQRLRVPSMVRADQAGTCIDLALLFAACLELVDIYPVVFLLKGHALPGWWRHGSFQEEYQQMSAASYSDVVVADASGNSAANAQTKSWHTGEASWAEVKRWIRERKLVPIETVRLTEHCGFVEAIEAGVQALDERADYDSMLDIVTARRAQVTPLPLLKDNA
ncbi:hypothetical protein ACG02S_11435 [Roseateles sp. DC23W]|uniref:Transglutaminase-like superfamily protein n=1 Tax=Pelomonas dachongensis TaxID=3299029 RepID=A0ABW7ELY8_9BURK